MSRYASLVATGSCLPEREVSNDLLRERFPEPADFVDQMEASTGIRRRCWAPEDWAASDLALRAARQALENAGRQPKEVDLIILGTDSPDDLPPATSVVLREKLGAEKAGTFDVACACASFPTGFATAAGLIAANPGIRTVLVVGVDLMHRLAADDPMVFFYGDGAGAAVLEASEGPGFLNAAFQAGGQARRVQSHPPEIHHEEGPRLVRRLAAEGGFGVQDIDFLIFTQVRKPSIELVMKDLGLPLERTHTVVEDWGYTGSACVPMALHDAREKGKIKSGDLVVLVGSGVGFNQAAVAYRA